MTKVRILAGLAGESWVSGEVLALPDDQARQLIAEERAEPLAETAAPAPRRRPAAKG